MGTPDLLPNLVPAGMNALVQPSGAAISAVAVLVSGPGALGAP